MRRLRLLVLLCLLAWPRPAQLHAMGGTDLIVRAGDSVRQMNNWPHGVVELLNDSARTNGWHDWFSEWPNDVEHFEFQVADTAAVNRLLLKFASIKAKSLQVRLAPAVEPSALGFCTVLKKGNNTAVVFSIGSQQQLDQWYVALPADKHFGTMQFVAAPVAVLPTLTIYVGNTAIDIAQLEIPANIDVSMGRCPYPFHKSNTVDEQERMAMRASVDDKKTDPRDSAIRAMSTKIDLFLKLRAKLRDHQ